MPTPHARLTGRDLERAGPELHVHVVVGDDGDLAARERDDHLPAHQVLESLVLSRSKGFIEKDKKKKSTFLKAQLTLQTCLRTVV